MNRAYSLLTITKADADQRIVEGIASTPEVDRVGDVVEPTGAVFKLPLPFLWQHRSAEPIGHVEFAEVKPDGISFRARLAKIAEAGTLRDRLDEAWQSIKAGLVRATSIGFQPLESKPIATGFRFTKWRWYELSAVTIPANESATIQAVKRLDHAARGCRVVRLSDPPGGKVAPVVRLNDATTPVRAAALQALDEHEAERLKAAERVKLGTHGQHIAVMGAIARTTDAELAALRARLDKLERG